MKWVEDSLTIRAATMLAIALADWRVQPNVSLGLLYIFPVLLAAVSLTV